MTERTKRLVSYSQPYGNYSPLSLQSHFTFLSFVLPTLIRPLTQLTTPFVGRHGAKVRHPSLAPACVTELVTNQHNNTTQRAVDYSCAQQTNQREQTGAITSHARARKLLSVRLSLVLSRNNTLPCLRLLQCFSPS